MVTTNSVIHGGLGISKGHGHEIVANANMIVHRSLGPRLLIGEVGEKVSKVFWQPKNIFGSLA